MRPAAGQKRRSHGAKRTPTKGWFQCPNSLAENQALLTPAEKALALMVLRKGGDGVVVSDDLWRDWTGLEPRAKKYAVAGLTKKCLRVDGHADRAKYAFDRAHWDQLVRTADRQQAARTEGRAIQPKTPKAVHPTCEKHGCMMLAEGVPAEMMMRAGAGLVAPPQREFVLTDPGSGHPEVAADDCKTQYMSPEKADVTSPLAHRTFAAGAQLSGNPAQPVAQKPEPAVAPASEGVQSGREPRKGAGGKTDSSSTPEGAERVWAKTLSVLRSIFPAIGVMFLMQLLAAIRKATPGTPEPTDELLAEVVATTVGRTKGRLRSEGLLLSAVPEDFVALRRARGKPPPGAPTDADHRAVWGWVLKCAAAVKSRGFEAEAKSIELVFERACREPDTDSVDEQIRLIGMVICEKAALALTVAQWAEVDRAVSDHVKAFGALSPEKREQLERYAIAKETLAAVGFGINSQLALLGGPP